MPDHAREQIREAIVAKLTGLASGAVVFEVPVYLLPAATTKAFVVTSPVDARVLGTGDSRQETIGGTVHHDLTITIEAVVKQVDTYQTVLDTLCAEAEAALASDPTLGGKVGALELESTESEFSGEGEKPVGRAAMTWGADYSYDASVPTVLKFA